MKLGSFTAQISLLETITFLLILGLAFYPIYYPFRKITYTKNVRDILNADINVLVFDWECSVPLQDCST
jgi:hypothetical protein